MHFSNKYLTAINFKTLTSLTSDTVLNVLRYGLHHFDKIQYTGEQRVVVTCKQRIVTLRVVWFYFSSAKDS